MTDHSLGRSGEQLRVRSREDPVAPISGGERGTSFPLGATVLPGGTNFSVFAKHAAAVQLLLFDSPEAGPSRVIDLDPQANRTYHYWHIFLPGIASGQIYAYRVTGPFAPDRGLCFHHDKILLDPYGKSVVRPQR
jgi:glycogen operon protein